MIITNRTGMILDALAMVLFIISVVVDLLTYTRLSGILLATGWGILGFEIGTEK